MTTLFDNISTCGDIEQELLNNGVMTQHDSCKALQEEVEADCCILPQPCDANFVCSGGLSFLSDKTTESGDNCAEVQSALKSGNVPADRMCFVHALLIEECCA
eukprot:CAMPEP_0197698262 /NCGR_PEP_ID=MMETSP1338-20131121/119072_1 /TAXON_ID=43686 ORGANISM="Pelagodinium beii, Strain RCC1491" /NCGR_SAMPLE_ID=MMETSP1338 /ASSEMBLY_ACC=CAM_ASM_000754 /LENGTH=102 /DNA_ID=CAMNT_0043281615 /DNA_START=70 /DNA_END=378 /DNA_ORIENTATION=+